MSSQKRNQTEFTLKPKKEIIDAAINEPNQSKLARIMSQKRGIDVKRTTMKGILSKRDVIEAAMEEGVSAKRKKLKVPINLEFDEGVLIWLKQAICENRPVSGDLINEKALKLAELLHTQNFTTS